MNSADSQKKPSPLSLQKCFRDLLPVTHEYFTYIKKVVRHRCRHAGFRRISTPVLEYKELFEKAFGPHGELLKKLYAFEDPAGRRLALKPEGVSGIIRAYIEHDMKSHVQPVELYYIDPFFRFEQDPKHHLCQFWQFGAVVIGENDSALSAQMIQIAYKILRDLGLESLYSLAINTIGCPRCRVPYISDLHNFYFGKERSLCSHCHELLEPNPVRLLACRQEDCRILAELAPKLSTYLCDSCKKSHKELVEYLEELKIPYREKPNLVGCLDYYTGDVFSFLRVNDPNESTVCAGGRMDGIVEALGGEKNVPVFGFAMGLERLTESMRREKIRVPSKDDIHVFVAQLGHMAKKKCLVLINALREAGIKTVGALGKGSMHEQIDLAGKFQASYMLMMGITEVRENTVILRDMKVGKQKNIAFDDAVREVIRVLGKEKLDTYSPEEILY